MERASGRLATQAVARMGEVLPWSAAMPADMPAEERSWVGLVAQAGVVSFRGLAAPAGIGGRDHRRGLPHRPREMTRSVSLPQVVELVRVAVELVETQVPKLAAPGEETWLRWALRLTASRNTCCTGHTGPPATTAWTCSPASTATG